jgi:putative spermidine/putrescine transport system ATP-binding protein
LNAISPLADEPRDAGRHADAGAVRFEGVEKTYDGETLVVHDLDLDIAAGEFLTLLGPSGSGKTTTLMMLAGFEVPTRGTISVGGRDITRVPPHKRGIGMVFQNYALFPHMSVAENLAFPLGVRGIGKPERKSRVTNALEMVRMEGFGARMPGQLSGGQQQRVALARALIFEPTLVLMDEPLGALDKQLREHMQYEIKDLHRRLGVTVIYVTHDQTEALTMSDRVAVFNHGRVQQVAPPRDIYERPQTAFVAQFIGENNRITAKIEKLAGAQAIAVTRSGQRILCEPAAEAKAGEDVLVSIRPEALSVASPGTGGENALPATVSNVIYHGDHIRLTVAAGSGEEFVVKAPTRQAEHATIGTNVEIVWNARDARALPI